ncbi:serine protease gd isoform X2 [Anabrus simplex]|uniref:serine protease gd isoform X2 n=1 Tax=Anabrus simplex TaxID=316456 RepID=UPI0035A2A7DA
MSVHHFNCLQDRTFWRKVTLLFALLVLSAAQRLGEPESPCPDVFKYVGDSKGYIRVWPPRSGLPLNLRVQLFLPAALPSKYAGRILLAEDKDLVFQRLHAGIQEKVGYQVFFPLSHPLPRIDRIIVNDNVVCQGPLVSAPVLTKISLDHTLYPLANTLNSPNNGLDTLGFGGANTGFNGFEPDGGDFGNNRPDVNVVPEDFYPSYEQAEPKERPASRPWEKPTPAPWTQPSSSRRSPVSQFEDIDFNERERPPLSNPWTQPNQSERVSASTRPNVASKDICGRSVQANELVVNGHVTKRGEWPWIVAIFNTTLRGQEFLCSGTLINRRHVVTAGHCIKLPDRPPVNPKALVVYLGKYRLRRFAEPDVQPREVERAFVHPDFGLGTSFDADVAVLLLTEPAVFTRYVIPICLWDRSPSLEPLVGTLGTVVGWGRDELGSKTTDEPRLVEMPIVSQEECLHSRMDFYSITSNRTLCAGFRNNTGPCNGDSGSGMVLPLSESSRPRWFLRGLVSVSLYDREKNSCDLGNYVVFTDLAKHQAWLATFTD